MYSNIGDPELINQMSSLQAQLSNGIKLIGKYGREYCAAERDYVVAKAQETLRLRSEGMPATLITDVVKGKVAKELFKRDTADMMYKTAIENVNALKLQIRVLQAQIDREWGAVRNE